jgi:hypothetical protein
MIDWILGRAERKQRYFHHISAKAVRKYTGDGVWNDYYKFCIERNPWERFISMYYWMHKTEPRPSLTEFMNSEPPQWLKKFGFDIYTIDGQIAVDKICLYENLEEELEQVRLRLNIPEKLKLPQAKAQYRIDKRNYREILNDEQVREIGEMFQQEISLFGYHH